ncbi:MAG: cytochrome c oxidase accessory protein CcoG [Flavobacteriales bacterium]|nr:cytochrome c oxidase accessory protein CcoG [Flavobacteriales bacterium]MCB9167431.1 cytochrome c oxidase accessory protein CcoG [Flavobacteriales bacterium]MCB9171034.1 cytochrome c oxidase accessory protein CcoG [Flavobacteriales bacterium]
MSTPEQPTSPQKDETFRDSLATVDKRGRRIWIYPKKPSGRHYKWRAWLSYTLLAFLFAGPFIRIGGEPLLMIDVLGRRFVIFGQTFWPQDIHLFVLAFIAGIVFIALFTVAFGRLFCGWVCPQTIFMEMVFRKIEYAIEGDWKQQQALNKGPWTAEKVWKKTLKHALFFAIAFLIGNTFLAYLIGSDRLIAIITEPVARHWGGLVAMLGFSVVFYGVFAFLREQVCTTICPYGRLQGVLLDRHSMVIAYDHVRGEQRAKFRKGEDRSTVGKGDCIDCKACVHVCPTGIDIRNGTQLECVNCTACIDACDHMMDSVGLPRGLVRYASESEIADRKPFRFTTRMKAYSAVLTILIGVIVTLIVMRSDVEATVLRTPGIMYQTQADGRISNLYTFKVVNKTDREMPITFKLLDTPGELQMVGKDVELSGAGLAEGELFIVLDRSELKGMKTTIAVGIFRGNEMIDKVSTSFVGPL